MASAAQFAANRANARKSTGPRSDEGKAHSSNNALKHGFNSKRLIVRDDEREEFDELRQSLAAEFTPSTPYMWVLFEQIIHAAWNIRRVERAEAELFENGLDPLGNPAHLRQMELLTRYRARHENSFFRFKKELAAFQTNLINFRNCIPPASQDFFPFLADIHSIHQARRNATRAFNWKHFQTDKQKAAHEAAKARRDAEFLKKHHPSLARQIDPAHQPQT